MQLWHNYKSNPSHGNRNAIVEFYMNHLDRLSAYAAAATSISFDEAKSAAYDGMVKAIPLYDLDAGIKFETYCTPAINGAITEAIAQNKYRESGRVVDGATNRRAGMVTRDFNAQYRNAPAYNAVIVDADHEGPGMAEKLCNETFEAATKGMQVSMRAIAKSTMVDGLTNEEAARAHGLSVTQVANAKAKAKVRMRKNLEGMR